LSNANSHSSKILETIDEMSRSNCLTRKNLEKRAKISVVKNAQNFSKKKKIVATVKKALKKKSFKSSSRDIENISRKFRLENVANSEDLALVRIKHFANRTVQLLKLFNDDANFKRLFTQCILDFFIFYFFYFFLNLIFLINNINK
jgi:hypothetical protein